jgi:hypothetical protein
MLSLRALRCAVLMRIVLVTHGKPAWACRCVCVQLRDHAPEGKLPWLDGGFKDWEHFHGTSFGDYNLWVARDELIPQVSSGGSGAAAVRRGLLKGCRQCFGVKVAESAWWTGCRIGCNCGE